MGNIKTYVDELEVMLSGLDGFSATIDSVPSVPISGSSVGLGTLDFRWDEFSGATQYQYMLEQVFTTVNVKKDSEPWQTAWFNSENTNITDSAKVLIDAGTLQANSNYVFYVRALDDDGKPISSVSHVNFFKDGSVVRDSTKPKNR